MTAVNIVQRTGEILVMTDGLGNHAQAAETLIAKVAILPHLPLLLAGRGLLAVSHVIIAKFACDVRGTFDDFIHWLPGFARQTVPEISALQSSEIANEIYVVGYSQARSRLESYFMASTDAYVSHGRESYRLYLEEEPMKAAPQPSDEQIAAARFVCPTAEDFDPLDHGIKLMSAQHRTHPESVGGFMQLSRVTREGISSHILHRWPERSGATHEAHAA